MAVIISALLPML